MREAFSLSHCLIFHFSLIFEALRPRQRARQRRDRCLTRTLPATLTPRADQPGRIRARSIAARHNVLADGPIEAAKPSGERASGEAAFPSARGRGKGKRQGFGRRAKGSGRGKKGQ